MADMASLWSYEEVDIFLINYVSFRGVFVKITFLNFVFDVVIFLCFVTANGGFTDSEIYINVD